MRDPVSQPSIVAFEVHAAAMRVLRGFRPLADRHEEIAQDVVADYFATVERHAAEGGPGIDNPAAWATTVARNRAIDLERGRKRRPADVPLGGVDEDAGVGDDDRRALERFLVRGARSPSLTVLATAQCDAILAALDDDERRLLLAAAEGLSYAAIAERLGLASADVVRRRLHRVREHAREASRAAGYDTAWHEHPRPYA